MTRIPNLPALGTPGAGAVLAGASKAGDAGGTGLFSVADVQAAPAAAAAAASAAAAAAAAAGLLHANRIDNPHGVTAAQLGAYTRPAVNGLLVGPGSPSSSIANRVDMAQAKLSNGNNQYVGSRFGVVIAAAADSLRLVYSNRRLGDNDLGTCYEQDGPALFQIRAVIEKPDTSGLRVTWQEAKLRGATVSADRLTVTVNPGELWVSDPVPLSVVAGQTLFIRNLVQAAGAGIKYPAALMDYAFSGSGSYYSNTDVNYPAALVGLGTIASIIGSAGALAGAPTPCMAPIAVLGRPLTPAPVVGIIGSSSAYGAGDTPEAPDFSMGYLARALTAAGVQHCRLGQSSDTLDKMLNSATWYRYRLEFLRACGVTHFVSTMGTNDTVTMSAAQMQALLVQMWDWAYGLGLRIVQCTFSPRTSSTDSFATLVNQTVAASESVRLATNAFIRSATHPALAGVWDVDALVADPTSGKFKVTGAAFGWTVDGLHLSQFAHRSVAASLAPLATALSL
jgi:lysophospholipase L1-like esterase